MASSFTILLVLLACGAGLATPLVKRDARIPEMMTMFYGFDSDGSKIAFSGCDDACRGIAAPLRSTIMNIFLMLSPCWLVKSTAVLVNAPALAFSQCP